MYCHTMAVPRPSSTEILETYFCSRNCLCTVWKILNGISADEVYTHLESHNVILVEQKWM